MASYISKIKVPGVTEAYLIKDNEGRLMIAEAYPGSTPAEGSYYVQDGNLYVVNSTGPTTTTVSKELQSIKQSIAGAMHYIGVTKTVLTDGATTANLEPQSEGSLTKTSDFVSGDVVLAPVTGKAEKYYEYVWNGDMWSEFGSTKPIGSMAYANKATGSTTITYNKSKYTGTVSVNEYSEGDSNYIKPSSVVGSVKVGTTTSASSVSKSISKLVTTSVGVVDGTGAAVTNISTTQKGLGTTSIYGVEATAVEASKVTNGEKTINVGSTQTTGVVIGLGATAAAAGNNPFVNATVDNDECLSWIEKPLGTTQIREASAMDITVPEITVNYVNGIAKVASSVTVATGTLVDKTVDGGDEVAIGVTTTTDSFAKKADKETTVATGALDANGSGIITGVTSTTDSFAKKADKAVVVATGALDANGTGADVIADITITDVTGLVTGITSTKNDGVLVEGTSGETGAIKVLTGITSADAEKNVTLIQGTDATEDVIVTIQVEPDPRT